MEGQYDRTVEAFANMQAAADLAAYAVARATFRRRLATLRELSGIVFEGILEGVPENHRAALETSRDQLRAEP